MHVYYKLEIQDLTSTKKEYQLQIIQLQNATKWVLVLTYLSKIKKLLLQNDNWIWPKRSLLQNGNRPQSKNLQLTKNSRLYLSQVHPFCSVNSNGDLGGGLITFPENVLVNWDDNHLGSDSRMWLKRLKPPPS